MAHHSVTTTTVSQAGAAAVAPPPPNRRRPAPSTEKRLVHYLTSANHSDGSALARSLALSSSRAPDTRAGMTEKFDRADVRVTILCRTQSDQLKLTGAQELRRPAPYAPPSRMPRPQKMSEIG